mmetsp:Transcript_69904/g.185795  ORF Transcript_69904/g.185795 Transcript_69904/m.185795 type:complete len:259 (-) Transcript_69904:1111-1887(-)
MAMAQVGFQRKADMQEEVPPELWRRRANRPQSATAAVAADACARARVPASQPACKHACEHGAAATSDAHDSAKATRLKSPTQATSRIRCAPATLEQQLDRPRMISSAASDHQGGRRLLLLRARAGVALRQAARHDQLDRLARGQQLAVVVAGVDPRRDRAEQRLRLDLHGRVGLPEAQAREDPLRTHEGLGVVLEGDGLALRGEALRGLGPAAGHQAHGGIVGLAVQHGALVHDLVRGHVHLSTAQFRRNLVLGDHLA